MARAAGVKRRAQTGDDKGLSLYGVLGGTSTWEDIPLRGGLRKEEEPDMQNAPENVPS